MKNTMEKLELKEYNLDVEIISSTLIIHVDNVLFMNNIRDIEFIWKNHIAEGIKTVALDCSKLELIDSTAIGTLVKLLNETSEHGTQLIIFDMRPSVQHLFETAHLDDYFVIKSKFEFQEMTKAIAC